MTDEKSDSIKLLKLLISDCTGGTDYHAWIKCPKCSAFNQLENKAPLMERLIKVAIRALENE